LSTKKFIVDCQDEGPNTLSYEVDESATLSVEIDDGSAVLVVNKPAAECLASIFARLATGSYENGFHLHVEENFDPDSGEALRVLFSRP